MRATSILVPLSTSFVLALGLAACTDDPEAAPTADDRSVEQCTADFSVDVTSGPEAGFHAGGKLELYPIGGGALTGVLADSRGPLAVVGSESESQLVLTFTLADGRKIVGVGPARTADCTGMREGVAIGPSLDATFSPSAPGTSVGHWLAADLVPQQIDYTVISYPGGLTSSDFGFTDNASAQVSCTGASGVTYDITCRDGRDPVRDAIAHFFGVPYCSDVSTQCTRGGGTAGPVSTSS